MHPAWSRNLSKRLVDRGNGHRQQVLALYHEACCEDFLSVAEREKNRNIRLAKLLTHASKTVPFYERLMKGDVVAPEDAEAVLQNLPIVGKFEIQDDPKAFLSRAAKDSTEDATGGSTGTPMKFFVDRPAQVAREASLYWSDSLAGWKYGERIGMLWGSDRDVLEANRHWRARLRWAIENRIWVNAFALDESSMKQAHRAFDAFRPHIMVAYAGSLFTFARYLEAQGVKPAYPVKGLVASAEVCTPTMREVINRVFPVEVFDRYGNREAGAIAAECVAHDGRHINEREFVLEIRGASSGQEEGPLLMTHLSNMAMPFIRYNTEDVSRMMPEGPCTCGRTTRKLAPIKGRVSDTIRTADGRLVHGEYFTHLMYVTDRVKRFQFVQEDVHSYRLVLAASREDVRHFEDEWRAAILDMVGADAELTLDYVEEIPVLKSGKHRFTFSKLKDNPYDG